MNKGDWMDKETPINSAIGLNENVEFMGKQLHIQTEILRATESIVITQIFSNGRVIFSKKTMCSNDSSEIQLLMNSQHAQVIRSLAEKKRHLLDAL
jgi:hypothetical protein